MVSEHVWSPTEQGRSMPITCTPEDCMAMAEIGRQRYPGVEVSAPGWARCLARAAHGSLPSLIVADLWLACACAENNPAALQALERLLATTVRRALARLTSDAAVIDEMQQRVRMHLLVREPDEPDAPGPPKEARILGYQARGSLAAWIRIITMRLYLNARRDEQARPDAALAEAVDETELLLQEIPELEQMRAQGRTLFTTALQEAFRSLPARARNILRRHHLDAVPLAELANIYQVHEGTVSRWLAAARAQLAQAFEQAALARLGDHRELEELMDLLRSRLDVSLRALFRSAPPGAGPTD